MFINFIILIFYVFFFKLNVLAKSTIGRIASPPQIKIPPIPSNRELTDTEALISVELLFVNADCPTNEEKKEHLQVANIQFNNLDIIGKFEKF